MPYRTIAELPPGVKDSLPAKAAEIYMAAHNAAMKQYDGDEAKSAATAWAAVKTKYEKQGDKWVAKESEASMDKQALQSKYTEIIQEAGRRNASADAARLKKIVELCQELLSDDFDVKLNPKKLEEAVKEADAVLAWLKEQAVTKTEDGQPFPAEAFAYAPDPEKPSEWKLRIWEDPTKKVTRAQLGRAAAALSPGGFRGQKVEIPREDLAAVKRKIRAAYRSLDVADEDIPRWVKETESRTLLVDVVSLAEATITAKGIASIVVIKPGLNSSKERYYPPEMLARDFKLFEGVKMYADHPTSEDERQRPERSIRDWVATLKNVRVDEKGQLIGEAVIVEPWMQAKLASLRDKGMLAEMGISINAVGTASKGEIDGAKTNVIERIVRVRSVDFVTEPGAGGTVQMYEVDRVNDVDLVTLETLRERRPDLVKTIETEAKAAISQEVQRKMGLEDEIKGKDTTIATLTTENTDLKAKLAEADKAKAKAEAQAIIKEAVGKAELPDAAKTRLLERFADAESDKGVAEAVQAESAYIAALSEAGKVKGMGQGKVDPQADRKSLKEAFVRSGMSEKDAEIAVNAR